MKFLQKHLDKILIGFYSWCLVLPSLRLWLIGTDKFRNWGQFLFTASPDILNVLIGVAAVFILFISKKSGKKLFFLDWIFITYIVTTIAWGAYLSGDIFLTASGIRLTYIPMLFYFVGRVLPTIYNDPEMLEKKLNKILDGIFFCFFLLAVIGLIMYSLFPKLQETVIECTNHKETAYFIVRMTSIIWTPVVFGFLMALACIYYYYKLLQKGNKKYYVFFCIIWISLMLSVSRGAIISFILGFIILSVVFRNWKRALAVFVLMAVIGCGVSLLMLGNLKLVLWIFVSSTDTMQMTSGVTRVSLWNESLKSFSKRPGGYGLGRAGWTAFEYLKNSADAAPYTTDGWYLKTACELGVYGLASYLIMTGVFFLKFFSYVWRNPQTIVSLTIVVIIMVHAQNVVSNVLDFHPYISFYWLLMGLTQAIITSNKQNPVLN